MCLGAFLVDFRGKAYQAFPPLPEPPLYPSPILPPPHTHNVRSHCPQSICLVLSLLQRVVCPCHRWVVCM